MKITRTYQDISVVIEILNEEDLDLYFKFLKKEESEESPQNFKTTVDVEDKKIKDAQESLEEFYKAIKDNTIIPYIVNPNIVPPPPYVCSDKLLGGY